MASDSNREGIPEELIRNLPEQFAYDRKWKQVCGSLRQPVTCEWNDSRVVAIGSDIHFGRWKSLHDFLRDYIWQICDKTWLATERRKSESDRHISLQWASALQKATDWGDTDERGFVRQQICGGGIALLQLGYDLYTLRHHQKLQESLLSRLLYRPGQFQGARHELFAAATSIRAGLDIRFEDEADLSSKHVEFIATHRSSGQQVAIEAKSKHRHGVLGFEKSTAQFQNRPAVKDLVVKAAKKSKNMPLVLFVDLNMPHATRNEQLARHRAVEQEVISSFGQNQSVPINLIVFTNCPVHYQTQKPAEAEPSVYFLECCNPTFPTRTSELIDDLRNATVQAWSIPPFFRDTEIGHAPIRQSGFRNLE